MFNGGMATTSTEIELPDVEPAAFLALLKFLYSDEVQIGPETVMTTLYTAKKYAVPALEAHCVEFLKKNLRADNAFMLLTQVRGGGAGPGATGEGRATRPGARAPERVRVRRGRAKAWGVGEGGTR
ncbi:BTB/POZ domain-containing protein 2 [Herpailurus yagouaroundi]|uniref:BTB/POZ domain-containing protein 2 n=1 Tax=Herpailurus yagouaroundi TaxID=1608482 RepID=UPI001AD6C6C1|nr:BTB/POZ domain-containing protein 2-like [Puma yagouaroundi]